MEEQILNWRMSPRGIVSLSAHFMSTHRWSWIVLPGLRRLFLSETFQKPHARECAYGQPFCSCQRLKFIHLSDFNAALNYGILSEAFGGFPADLFHTFTKPLLPLFRCFNAGHH